MSTLAQLIANFEGWNKSGTIARANNNPGNLRAGPRAVGNSSGFAVYASAADGWADLERQIQLDADAGFTLGSFIAKYAPPAENDTASYGSYLARQLGVSLDTALSAISGDGAAFELPDWLTDPLGLRTEYDYWPLLAVAAIGGVVWWLA